MKLKQRVIVTGSIFLTMVALFTIGLQLNWPQPESAKRPPPPPQDNKPQGVVKSSEARPPSSEKRERFVAPAWPVNVPGLPEGFNMSRLDIGRLPMGPRRVLEQKFRGVPPDLINMPHPPQGKMMSVPADVAELNPWAIWRGWVEKDALYPQDMFYSDEMNHILTSMATGNITSFGLGTKGTQLKATAMLGDQRTVFKPKRYAREHIIEGDPYAGFDRHTGEIAGFHLDGILGFRIAPPVVGRRLNLTQLKPVTSKNLLETYMVKGGNLCFYGKCYYCKPAEAACADGEVMEGSLTLWLPEWYKLKTRRHPYQRTYRDGVKAKWENDKTYCRRQLLKPTSEYFYGILEFTDTAIFDFLMGNADRHHYETYERAKYHGKLMHIDNGKTFGNPSHDEMSILAPLTQCCRIRSSTWQRLAELAMGEPLSMVLDRSMQRDPLWPILTPAHLQAIDRRLGIIASEVQRCTGTHGRQNVIFDTWP